MAEIIKLKKTVPCPICGRPSSQANHPFCSNRCQDIDLNRWLSGSYVIPASADDDEAETVAQDLGDEEE
ncbi:MAG: DNA gyrase inhibitor YacG [Devosia sp.]